MRINETVTIHQGDCLELIKKIPDSSIDAIITDPPYFLGMTHNGSRGVFLDLAVCKPFYERLFNEYKRVLKPTGAVYFFCDWRGYAFYYPIFDSVLGARNMLVWDKQSGLGSFYTFEHELVLFTTPNNKWRCKGARNIIRDIKSFSMGAKKTNGEKLHPTQKPVELMERFILDSTNEGGTVLDTFMGSGTTGIACAKTKRNFIGFEIDDEYFKIAQKRLEEALRVD